VPRVFLIDDNAVQLRVRESVRCGYFCLPSSSAKEAHAFRLVWAPLGLQIQHLTKKLQSQEAHCTWRTGPGVPLGMGTLHIEFPGLEPFQHAAIADVLLRDQPDEDEDEDEDEGDDSNDNDDEDDDEDEGYSE